MITRNYRVSRHTHNPTGRPLSSTGWLDAHHLAKQPERRAFCRRLAELAPRSIVDLGCATGLWLHELDRVLPQDCHFTGLDTDPIALGIAAERAAGSAPGIRRVDNRMVVEPAEPVDEQELETADEIC